MTTQEEDKATRKEGRGTEREEKKIQEGACRGVPPRK